MAENVPIQGIEFEVKGNTDQASASLRKFANNVRQADNAASKHDGIRGLSKTLSSIKGKLGSTLKSVAAYPFKSLSDGAKGFASRLGNVASSLKRIAFYRIIRSVIKDIGKAMDEGSKNAYFYAKTVGESTQYIATAMDSLNSASYKLSNQAGAAFNTLYAQVAPVLEQLISVLTRAAAALTQFFAAFGGKSTYLQAIDYAKDWEDLSNSGSKAAKEWKNQLMGFDEINRLEEPSNGGGGGGADLPDYENMFREAEIGGGIKNFVDRLKSAIQQQDWPGLGNLLGEKVNSIIPNDGKLLAIGYKFGGWIKGVVNTAYYTLKTIDFSAFGRAIGLSLDASLRKLLSDENGGSGAENLGRYLIKIITSGLDFAINLLGNREWRLVGQSIGDFLIGTFDEAIEWIGKYDWGEIARNIPAELSRFIDGLDPSKIGESLSGLLKGAFDALTEFAANLDVGEVVTTLFDSIQQFIDGFDDGGVVASLARATLVIFAQWVSEIPQIAAEMLATITGSIANLFSDLGLDGIAGFFEGVTDWLRSKANWWKENFIDPMIADIKRLLGIHSPSTVFAEIGDYAIQGLWNGMEEKWKSFTEWLSRAWDGLKTWWGNLSLGAFSLKLPHITYSLVTVPILGTIPDPRTMRIDWYAKGGIVDGATLIGAGEAGKEAIIPLERNTEWISKVAREMNVQQTRNALSSGRDESISDGIEESGIVTVLYQILSVAQDISRSDRSGGGNVDFDSFVKAVTRTQRQQARAAGTY